MFCSWFNGHLTFYKIGLLYIYLDIKVLEHTPQLYFTYISMCLVSIIVKQFSTFMKACTICWKGLYMNVIWLTFMKVEVVCCTRYYSFPLSFHRYVRCAYIKFFKAAFIWKIAVITIIKIKTNYIRPVITEKMHKYAKISWFTGNKEHGTL